MLIVAGLVGVVVLIALVAWLSDRRDRAGGADRLVGPDSMGAGMRRGRQAFKWKGRSLKNRWLTPMDTGDDRVPPPTTPGQ